MVDPQQAWLFGLASMLLAFLYFHSKSNDLRHSLHDKPALGLKRWIAAFCIILCLFVVWQDLYMLFGG